MTQADVVAAGQEAIRTRRARLPTRRRPSSTTTTSTATTSTGAPAVPTGTVDLSSWGEPPPFHVIPVYVTRSGWPYETYGRLRLATMGAPQVVFGGGNGAEYVNIGVWPTIAYDIYR